MNIKPSAAVASSDDNPNSYMNTSIDMSVSPTTERPFVTIVGAPTL